MKMKMFESEDGFLVKGKDENEVTMVAAMHMMMMHPNTKMSMKDMKKMVMDCTDDMMM